MVESIADMLLDDVLQQSAAGKSAYMITAVPLASQYM